MTNKKGIALILAVGILAILAVIATAFSLNMRLEYRAAMNYYNGVKARYFAESALQRAIRELREHVKASPFDYFHTTEEPWTNTNPYNNNSIIGVHIPPTTGTSVVTSIVDEQRKINLNYANTLLLTNFLGNLSGISNVADVVSKIDNNKPYNTLLELRTIAKISEADFNIIKNSDAVTVNSYYDPNTTNGTTNNAPINVNTCSQVALKSVLEGLSYGGYTIMDGEAGPMATFIIGGRPFTSWKAFEDRVLAFFPSPGPAALAKIEAINKNCNPNKTKPSGATTELCFHAGGYYTIKTTGTVTLWGATIATSYLTAIVKINDVYTETKKAQFNLGTPVRVTWLDSCPLKSTDIFGSYNISTTPQTISDSIKLGFWDDFSDSTYSNAKWTKIGSVTYSLDQVYLPTWAQFLLDQDTGYSNWTNYAMSIYEKDNAPGVVMKDVGWFFLKGTVAGDPAVLHSRSGYLEWGPLIGTKYAYQDPSGSPGEVIFLSDAEASAAPYFLNPATNKYNYQPQIRIFRYRSSAVEENDDTDNFRTLFSYDQKKRFNVKINGANANITVYASSGSTGSFSVNDLATNSGKIGMYSNGNQSYWDDVRIIPTDGNFTSKVINSTGNSEWGTITGTVTLPATASATETVTYQSLSNTDGGSWKNASPTVGGAMTSVAGNSMQYRVILATADPDINETPVLEDITITYLPKTKIESYTFSQ